MEDVFAEIAGLDRLVHEPARLALLTALGAVESADFLFLQRLTGLTKGNLSSHLAKLEAAGLVQIEKQFRGKVPNTSARLTALGRRAIDAHWRQLEVLRRGASRWKP
jgi:DNA-binding transcriptional ArsR family regulator